MLARVVIVIAVRAAGRPSQAVAATARTRGRRGRGSDSVLAGPAPAVSYEPTSNPPGETRRGNGTWARGESQQPKLSESAPGRSRAPARRIPAVGAYGCARAELASLQKWTTPSCSVGGAYVSASIGLRIVARLSAGSRACGVGTISPVGQAVLLFSRPGRASPGAR